jgi:hypothetical protein
MKQPNEFIFLIGQYHCGGSINYFSLYIIESDVYTSSKGAFELNLIPNLSYGLVLFINYAMKLPILDCKTGRTQPNILLEPNFNLISYFPSIPHLCYICIPHHPLSKN